MDKNLPDLIEDNETCEKVSFIEESIFFNGHLIAEGTPFIKVNNELHT